MADQTTESYIQEIKDALAAARDALQEAAFELKLSANYAASQRAYKANQKADAVLSNASPQ